MTYNLKRSKGGIRAEKTYEFDIGGTPPKTAAGKGSPGRDRGSYQRSEAAEALRRRRNETARRAVALRRLEAERAAAAAKRRADILEYEQRIHTVRSPDRVPLPMAIIAVSFICTVLFMYIIFNMVQISDRGRAINSMKSELSALEEEIRDLEKELEEKNDIGYIEEYAVNELGMVKSDQLARHYVNIENEDKIELVAGGDAGAAEKNGFLQALFKTAKEKITVFWEYIS